MVVYNAFCANDISTRVFHKNSVLYLPLIAPHCVSMYKCVRTSLLFWCIMAHFIYNSARFSFAIHQTNAFLQLFLE